MDPSRLQTTWRANLDLGFTRREDTTILSRNLHTGPLQVQKALYPEGRDTCHVVVLHPPGGIAAGDALCVRASCAPGARIVLTTPGATKWYRSAGNRATQRIHLMLEGDAVVEWLPRENIFFDDSSIAMQLDADLSADAKYFGWEIMSFGRRASGEKWGRGTLQIQTRIRRAGRLLWSENANVNPRDGFTQSPVGLRGFTVCGTFVVAGCEVGSALLKTCREAWPAQAQCEMGITRTPSMLIARYLGDSSQEAFAWFTDLWSALRPELLGKVACVPRVWAC
ncbi:MAG: urease accessory protein UreD [Steroidobacteraceae bacterium]